MGLFPYDCEVCGGGFQRCGVLKHQNCLGGQFCFEENVIIKINNQYYQGLYDGDGYVKIKKTINNEKNTLYNKNAYPIKFHKFFDNWFLQQKVKNPIIASEIYCNSCFTNNFSI